ncbi:DUF6339 family protein [Cellulomonas sp. Leaf334]|uniref:DUF6339 family protein n=1 Tax=Cellulomonas sp. Leaf334 TaxID=1736339 RepID=UPI0006F5AD63|nr:DUF6339 family protein [Cellulomonas sp. Leaf334]KQR10430.1 hypothetical protein ASF78_17235 [Cellulomonas sp. Leaf334]
MPEVLGTYNRDLAADERTYARGDRSLVHAHESDVIRSDQTRITLAPLDSLMRTFWDLVEHESWPDAPSSDRWLAPRVHAALRLTRREASDQLAWLWLALHYDRYVTWRWGEDAPANRWKGSINKQAFARLWWSGELFRLGPDYYPVERALVRQDFVNSYLHRPAVRNRPFAAEIIALTDGSRTDATVLSPDEINLLAVTVNLALAGTPPEVEIGPQNDDVQTYSEWVRSGATTDDWTTMPEGPPTQDVNSHQLSAARALVDRCWSYRSDLVEAHDSRAAQRARDAVEQQDAGRVSGA